VEGSATVVDVVVGADVVVVEVGASVVTMIVSEVQAPRTTAMRMAPALFTATSYAPVGSGCVRLGRGRSG
jgi:hypothetical protein